MSHPDAVESWVPESQLLSEGMSVVSPDLSPKAVTWRTKEAASTAYWNASLRSAGFERSDRIAQVSRIIRHVQATGRRGAHKVAIAPNGSIELTITTDSAESQTNDFAKLAALDLAEPVVQ